jgi:hypothetical protein
MGGCHAGDAPFPLWFRPASIRILCGSLAVSLYALLNLGVWHGKNAIYEIREGIEL